MAAMPTMPAIRTKAAGKVRRRTVLRTGAGGPAPGCGPVRPVFDATGGVDGWVSMEVSPLLADDTAGSIAAARIYRPRGRPNLFIKIPGTPAGVPAIEESIFAGVPINVTLLFSREQYLGAAEAYLRGIERRIAPGRDPNVGSVASLFVSRWDAR